MLSEAERGHLKEILNNIDLAERFASALNYEGLRDNLLTLYAVIRCLEIISEASRRLSEDLKARHPDITWKEMAAAGNFYRHNYEEVTSLRVWKTLRESLPPLRAAINNELARED